MENEIKFLSKTEGDYTHYLAYVTTKKHPDLKDGIQVDWASDVDYGCTMIGGMCYVSKRTLNRWVKVGLIEINTFERFYEGENEIQWSKIIEQYPPG